ncbi:hypothetical protein OUZ56_017012 [Daphnia magna]|uniref:Uncharacterized protein n=1 Tax=Daphnia magna TaxID=35525 RepID=A0ABR0ARX6_9CRUS|nr:hypothetical protein OUZ56_017012 [Daphnia magna]
MLKGALPCKMHRSLDFTGYSARKRCDQHLDKVNDYCQYVEKYEPAISPQPCRLLFVGNSVETEKTSVPSLAKLLRKSHPMSCLVSVLATLREIYCAGV